MNTRKESNLFPLASYRFVKEQSLYQPIIIHAESTEETHRHLKEGHYRRRHEQFAVKYGWEPVKDDGMEFDAYDLNSHCDYALLVHRNNQEVGAGCRLIRSTPQVRLPIQEFLFDPESVPVGSIEISRMTGTPEARHSSYPLLGCLLEYLSECGVSNVYVTIRERLLESYAHGGFDCYERLPGKAMEKISRKNGEETKEYFLPVLIGLTGYQQALHLLSKLCA